MRHRHHFPRPGLRLSLVMAVAAALLVACTSKPALQSSARKEMVFALTMDMDLIQFNAGQPGTLLTNRPVKGLPQGERLVGIDFRVARGVLFALGQSGRLYTLQTETGEATLVAPSPISAPLGDGHFGVDFNPTVDRIRVVSDTGLNLRIHPDTGALIDGDKTQPGAQTDAPLRYAAGDIHLGRRPQVAAAGYTYNKDNDKLTTLYVIDRGLGILAMQGGKEGSQPMVSPDTGLLSTVGALGVGGLLDASFDISDVANTPLLAARTATDPRTRLYLIDLATGQAQGLGIVGTGVPVVGLAIEP